MFKSWIRSWKQPLNKTRLVKLKGLKAELEEEFKGE